MKRRMRGIALSIVLIVSTLIGNTRVREVHAFEGIKDSNSKKQTELVLWTYQGTEIQQEYLSAIKEYEASHPGVTIKTKAFEFEDYKPKLKTAAAANQLPDIFYMPVGGFAEDLVINDKVLCLDDYYKDYSEDITKAALSSAIYENKLYGSVATHSISVLWYNKAMFQEQGLKVPTTGDELVEVCKQFKNAGIQPIGLAGNSNNTWVLAMLYDVLALQSAGVEKVSKALHKKGQSYKDADFLKAATDFKTIVDICNSVTDDTDIEYTDVIMEFCSEEIPMFITSSFSTYQIMEYSTNPDNISVAPIPVINSMNSDATDYIGGGNDVLMVAATTKHPDLAATAVFELTKNLSKYAYLSGNGIPAWKVDYDDSKAPRLLRELTHLASSATSVTLYTDTFLAVEEANEFLSLLDSFYKDDITAVEFIEDMDVMLRKK